MQPKQEEHHAVVIGINEYSEYPALKGPVTDAEDFYAWLCDQEGGNLPEENIRRLLSSESGIEQNALTPNRIEALFEPFVTAGVQGRFGERLYVFIAGHGFGDAGDMGRTALYAANAKKLFPWHVAVTDYVEWLRRRAVFAELVLIMDCCRTVNPVHMIREPQYPFIARRGGHPDADKVKYFYAFAVSRGKIARERRFEDGQEAGIFTRTLLNALKTARPVKGQVTGQALKDQIHNTIDKFADQVQIDPPEIRLDSSRDITFLRRKSADSMPVRVVVEPYRGGETLVLFDGSFREIRREQTSAATTTLELEPGLYKLAVSETGRQQIFEVPSHEQITV
ncbi:MAG: caspase family protein [Candidatus Electrothrix sp. YB6]